MYADGRVPSPTQSRSEWESSGSGIGAPLFRRGTQASSAGNTGGAASAGDAEKVPRTAAQTAP